jgi:hypothetical protein
MGTGFAREPSLKRKRPGDEARPRSPQEPNPRYVALVSRKIGGGPSATNYDESFYLESLWHITFAAAFVDFSAQHGLIQVRDPGLLRECEFF